MFFYLLSAIPLAGAWMLVTAQLTFDSLAIGYVIGLLVLLAVKPQPVKLRGRGLITRFFAFVVYSLVQFRDIFLSSVYVARRALAWDMRLKPGIIAVPTQDESGSDVIAALSAHSITLTPGEIVVDFEEGHTMYVHCLDVDAAARTIVGAQARRLALFKRMLNGREEGHRRE